ncbi:helix-turn-helix transcriptional regulator [Streptomyces sp. CA-106110]|uniref:helix-turn-helix transcriptional regulator n=1 Tax=Streptomyces sp. CA-106110 TaxID=3240044 RepID=UPI003D919FE1
MSRDGARLCTEPEARARAVWAPDAGKTSAVLARLEEEGLVKQEERGARRHAYALTEAGRDELHDGYLRPQDRCIRPVERPGPPRNEQAAKPAVAVDTPEAALHRLDPLRGQAVLTRCEAMLRCLAAPPDGSACRARTGRVAGWITSHRGHMTGVMHPCERMAAWRCRGTKGRPRTPRGSWS